jgi:hypothetical protein
MTLMSTKEILQSHNLKKIAESRCHDLRHDSMQDLAKLNDEDIDALSTIINIQKQN